MFKSVKTRYLGFKFNSKWELLVFKTLISVIPREYLPIKVNKRIPGYQLELDLYIPKLNIAFELQGPTHIFLLRTIINDLRKAAICKLRGIKLYYLNYKKYYSKHYFRVIFNQYKKNGTNRRHNQ